MKRTGLVCLLALFGLAGVVGPAEAGRLGKVTSGLKRAAGGSGGRGGGGRGGRGGGGTTVGGRGHSSGHAVGHGGTHHGHLSRSPILWGGTGTGAAAIAPVRADLYLGLESVVESDRALQLDGALGLGMFRLGGRLSSYTERQGPTDAAPNLVFNLWGVTGGLRLFQGPDTELFAESGVAGLSTRGSYGSEVVGTGLSLGLTGEHRLAPSVSLTAEARRLFLGEGVRANEARAGLQWTVLRASYRVLDFNVGPPLRGPELGIALRF